MGRCNNGHEAAEVVHGFCAACWYEECQMIKRAVIANLKHGKPKTITITHGKNERGELVVCVTAPHLPTIEEEKLCRAAVEYVCQLGERKLKARESPNGPK